MANTFVSEVGVMVLDSDLYGHGLLPSRATQYSCAVDLRIREDVCLLPGHDPIMIGTGIALDMMRSDWVIGALILPRSGMGRKGVCLANTIGLIDMDYQGEIFLPLVTSRRNEAVQLYRGDRVVQMMFLPVCIPKMVEIDEFSTTTTRGSGGFGHTGVR